ncbi:AAA family ATPase [Blattabacterium sp. (Blaberus giganteus)]|uniref:AAA family ATPase n=1 Tax=Blattabacterium sp. (Blaberus giganteus) TaxID=1186051 RepID=UPI00025F6E29|nr:AAA family ATPase [Blattabacterium sp. (Blaberus giganteus)]AFJ90507.1 DNA polymerase III subunit gamma/tau [Blattabacterium sp. (Blaberus giganteus)]
MNKIFYGLSEKYKPLKWNEVIGQSDIIFILKKTIQENCLSQILFFFGPEGVGKNTCARILSNELNSSSELEDFSLNTFEIHEFFNNSSEYIYKIVNQSRFYPKIGKYNVLIINNIHTFSQYIFNYFLKLIEEKHPHILFIFCSSEEKKIPKLILSRSQVYEFKSISTKEIFLHLKMIAKKENIEVENEALFILSKHVKGSISKAIHLFDRLILYKEKRISKEFIIKKLGIINIKYYFEIVDYLIDKKIHKILILLDQILQEKIDFYDLIIGLTKHFRNLFLSKNYETISILKFKKEIIFSYIAQSKKVSYFSLINAFSICNRFSNEYKKLNKNNRLTIEIYLIQLAYLFYKNSSSLEEKKKKNEEFYDYNNHEKIKFLQKNWIKFVQKLSNKINPIYLYFLENEIQFEIEKNKIYFIIPYKLENYGFSLIQTRFIKYLKEKFKNLHIEFEVVKKNSNIIEQYNLLYKKNKLIETLIERLNLKISSSNIQEDKNSYN